MGIYHVDGWETVQSYQFRYAFMIKSEFIARYICAKAQKQDLSKIERHRAFDI